MNEAREKQQAKTDKKYKQSLASFKSVKED